MDKTFHFISGLPRSGSTLLSALLAQNPRFTAGMTSPVATLCSTIHPKMTGGEFDIFFDDEKRLDIMRSIVQTYYAQTPVGGVVFDTNRNWTARMALLAELYPNARIICCVREIGWILDSIERMLNKNPARLSKIFGYQPGTSVYGRSELLMNVEKGLVGLPLITLREAWFGDNASRLIIVPYENLVRHPERTMSRLYAELKETQFAHDFENVTYDNSEYDDHIGMPGLHTVRTRVAPENRMSCLPPDLFKKHAGAIFWHNPELNPREVTII